MTRPAPPIGLLAVLLALVLVAPAGAQEPPYQVQTPRPGALYQDGHGGRYLLGGQWLFRADLENRGVARRYMRHSSPAGWTRIAVPHAWNAAFDDDAAMRGGVVWYRKDFRLPSARRALDWLVRFESVNYRAKVWLNGHRIGSHTGAYLPWELRTPYLKRRGVNRLVLRIDNRRFPTDFPPSSQTATGTPSGGWWNYGGILREVYLRKVDRVDLSSVAVHPLLPCASCPATIRFSATARNSSARTQRVRVRATFGGRPVSLGRATMSPGSFHVFRGSTRIANPRLWSPGRPFLYPVGISAAVGRGSTVARHSLRSGIRSIKVSNGRLMLNGAPTNFRGVGLHEDAPGVGFAIDNATRQRFVAATQELGATVIRAHYPLHPQLHELADRAGVLIMSEVPVYGVKTPYLKRRSVRRLATEQVRRNVVANQNHASVLSWSLGNELSPRPGPVQGYYIRQARNLVRRLDPTRPAMLAVAAYPAAGCQSEYGPLEIIGVNDYFGWYPGPGGQLADREGLSPYLDALRACYPNKAIVVSEFGAEANRDGPPEEKGTWGFQRDFVNYHLGVFATKPWLSGAIYWTLQEFKIRPRWDGGNPRPSPPLHQKGLLTITGERKPAWGDVQRSFLGTVQYGRR